MANITERMPRLSSTAAGPELGAADPAAATIAGLFARSLARDPGRPLLLAPGGTKVGYGEAAERARALAAGLAAEGIEPGDVVAVQLPNVAEFVLAYLAIGMIGAVMQTLHMPYRRAELSALLGHSRARAAIVTTTFKDERPAATVVALLESLPTLKTIVALGRDPPAGCLAFADLGQGALPAFGARQPAPRDPALLLYTSGTTAAPKGVPVRHAAFAGNADRSVAEFAVTADDRILAAAPFSHLYGLFTLHLAFAAGASIVLLPAFSPPGLVEVVRNAGATMVFAAPAHLAACRDAGLLTRDGFAAVRLVCLSGSAVPPDLAGEVDETLGAGVVVQLWGMTELQAGSYGRPGDAPRRRFTTAGRASPGTELRVVGDDGAPLAADSEGRLQVRGASVFEGYLDNPEATAAAVSPDGWFETGDTARLTPDGDLVLTGRVKEVINRGGVKYAPGDVEIEIERMAKVARAAIVPMPDPVLGERGCVFVAPADPAAPPTLADVTGRLEAAGVARFKWPERLELIETMPLTPTQKVMRGRLGEILAHRLATEAAG